MADEKMRGGFGRAFGLGKVGDGSGEPNADDSGAAVAIVVADSVSDYAASRSAQPVADVTAASESSAETADAEAAPKKARWGRKPNAEKAEAEEAEAVTFAETAPMTRPEPRFETRPMDAPVMPERMTVPAPAKPVSSDAPVPKSRLGRARGADTGRGGPRVRRARLKIVNIDPWSVMKVSFLFSVALGIVLLVAIGLLWLALDFMGFFSTVASTVSDVSGNQNSKGFDVVAFFSLPRVMGMATIVALVDTIMITALTTLGAYLYNLSTDMVGGVEVTLAEEE
ncbi:MAG TPA: DUF3566 domain-containing protein [Sporichthyaceae bacterium]